MGMRMTAVGDVYNLEGVIQDRSADAGEKSKAWHDDPKTPADTDPHEARVSEKAASPVVGQEDNETDDAPPLGHAAGKPAQVDPDDRERRDPWSNMDNKTPGHAGAAPQAETTASYAAPAKTFNNSGDWFMDFVEAHPELNYHQAEVVRLTTGSDPRRMPENIDRALYLLRRLRALV